MKIFYFTATGNCLDVAKRFGGELYSIPAVLKGNERIFQDEKIGLVFPCYGLIAPKIVREFIERVTLKSNYLFTIMTYGNFSGDCTHWFSGYAAQKGLHVDYANELLMIDNYLPFFDMKKQREKTLDIETPLKQILEDVGKSRKFIRKNNFLKKCLSWFSSHFNEIMFTNGCRKFRVDDRCNQCGTCVSVCPRRNVVLTEKPVFGKKCIFCLACIQLCPQKAIRIKNEANPDERFKNERIRLEEIIASNNQM